LTADISIGGGNEIAYYSEYTSNSIRHSGVLRPEGTSRGMHKRVKTTYYGYATNKLGRVQRKALSAPSWCNHVARASSWTCSN
jgi:hypothetical protein